MSIRIMIVEDEAIIALSWAELLESEGYEVTTALDGKEAIEILNQSKPDVVFTDLFMPEMNGIELCRRIKAVDPKIEVVLISGNPYQMKDCQSDFINAGGRDDILIKPVSVDSIMETLEIIMREKA